MSTKKQPHLVYEGFIAGLVYGDFTVDQVGKQVKPGTVLLLHWEPENPFDARAVVVTFKNKKLGYIPRDRTEQLHAYRERGIPVRCHVKNVAKTNPTHRMVLVEVYAKSEPVGTFINY